MSYGFRKDGSYVSPSSWWRGKLGHYNDGFEKVSSKASLEVLQSFKLRKALHNLARTVNLVENSHGNKDKALTLAWGDGKTLNRPHGRQVTLDATDFLNNPNEAQGLDVLTGQALTLSSMKRTMDLSSFTFYQIAKNSGAGAPIDTKTALNLFEANEVRKAQKAVTDNWSGFSDYFNIYREANNTMHHDDIASLIPEASFTPQAFSTIVGWNVMNPDNRVVFGIEHFDSILQKAEDMTIATPDDPTEHAADFLHQTKVAQYIIDNLEIQPPDQDNNQEGQDDESCDNDNGDEDNSGQQNDGSGPGNSKRELNTDWKGTKSLADKNLFGSAAKKHVGSDGVLKLDDETLRANNPLNIFDYYPDKDTPLSSLGVVRVHSTNSRTYKENAATMKSAISHIKNSLSFRSTKMSRFSHGMEEGDLDEGSLHKIPQNNNRVFSQRTQVSKPDIAITLLIDLSGSMSIKDKYADARNVAIAMTEALKDLKGVHLTVLGHTANFDELDYINETKNHGLGYNFDIIKKGCTVLISELYGRNHKNPYALTAIRPCSDNFDGYAVEYAAKVQLAAYPEAKQKLVFVISDGNPCNGPKHMRESVDNVRRSLGTQVYGIGVSNAYSEKEGTELYGPG